MEKRWEKGQQDCLYWWEPWCKRTQGWISGKLRRLTPIELERLNQFPDDHTLGATDTKRAFFMGNALVIGVVTKLSKSLLESLKILTK